MLDNWQTFARRLADSFTVYAIDLRNHGRSPHDGSFDYPTLAGDIVEFISHHKLDHVALIGHSLGGKVAMQTALSHPQLIDHLMVVDISPRAYESGHDAIFEALLSTDLSLLKTRKQIEQALIGKLHDKEVVLFLMKNVARHKDGSFFWRMNLPVLTEKYSNTTSSVEARHPFEKPTLFVRGGRSKYIRDQDWPDILDLFPNATLRTIEHAGHWVHADAMEELLVETRKLFNV
jgi:pimeloyl-ACP methyl ester carboxylesterase